MALGQHTRITVALSRDEFEALRETALKAYRHPRDQARYILRSVLLGAALPTDSHVEHIAAPSPACTPEPIFSP